MVTIGDVFSVVAGLLAICISAWAFMLATTLLFTQRTSVAHSVIEAHPWRSFSIGLAIMLTLGLVSLGMIGNPIPGVKLMGVFLSLGLLSISAFGAGGLAHLVGERMQPMDPSLSPYRAVAKGAAILVAAGLLPFIGWWVFAPVVLAVSMGAGVSALLVRERTAVAVQQ